MVLEGYSLPFPHEAKPVEVARLGLGTCIPLLPPPLVPPTKKGCVSQVKIDLSDRFAVFSENSYFKNSDPMLIDDFIFISLVLMEGDTYNLFESYVLEYP